jgi:hypothetical protein
MGAGASEYTTGSNRFRSSRIASSARQRSAPPGANSVVHSAKRSGFALPSRWGDKI